MRAVLLVVADPDILYTRARHAEEDAKLRRFGIVRGMVSLFLTGSVSMQLSLSTADLRGLTAGLLAALLLCVVYALGTLLFRADAQRQLAKAAAVPTVFFSLGLLLCLLFGLLARLAMIRF